MKMVKILCFTVILLIYPICFFSQDDVSSLEEHKTILLKTHPHQFERAEIRKVEKISPKHSKIYYIKDGNNYEAVVNSNRKDFLLLATCMEMPTSELPKIVVDAFKNGEFGKSEIEKSFAVTTPYSSNFYRIDVRQDNQTRSLFYDKLGQFQEAPY